MLKENILICTKTWASLRITLLDVAESVIGEIFLNDCIIRPSACNRSQTCAVHRVWDKVRRQLRETLQKATFASLLAAGNRSKPSFMPQ